jgi:hypothetical protein
MKNYVSSFLLVVFFELNISIIGLLLILFLGITLMNELMVIK